MNSIQHAKEVGEKLAAFQEKLMDLAGEGRQLAKEIEDILGQDGIRFQAYITNKLDDMAQPSFMSGFNFDQTIDELMNMEE